MATIVSGACVGVFYRDPTNSGADCRNSYCVHNGRLVGGVINETATTIRVSRSINSSNLKAYRGIILSHLALSTDRTQVIQQFLYFSRNQLISVKDTPFSRFNTPNCTRETHDTIPNIIYPGECVGIQYLDANNVWQIKNGRYLYWRGQTNHCILDLRPQSTNRQSLREIFYSHYVLNNQPIPTDIVPQKTSRGRGAGRGESRVFVYKLRIPENNELINIKPVVSPSGFFRSRRIIYQ